MNILLIILTVMAALAALVLILAAIAKKDFQLEKQVTVNRPRQDVFDYIKLIRNQEKYSVWVMRDPPINITYTGTDGTTGFRSSWTSHDKNVGVGEQEIIKIEEGNRMEVEIRFEKPFKATNHAVTSLVPIDNNQTRVSQLFYGRQKYPMNIMNFMMDKLVGKDMEQNLQNLKKNLEK